MEDKLEGSAGKNGTNHKEETQKSSTKPARKKKEGISKREKLLQQRKDIDDALAEHDEAQLQKVLQLASKHRLQDVFEIDVKALDLAFSKIAEEFL